MFRFTKIAVAALTLGTGLVLGGCQSNKPSPDAMTGTPSSEGIACDKCKTTWTKVPTMASGPRGRGYAITGYSDRKQMVCPECKSMVENMFATGKLEHTCTACGGNMAGCAVH